MPNIGEVRNARELGRAGHSDHIYLACPKCGKERWIPRTKTLHSLFTGLSHMCATQASPLKGEAHYRWQGGRANFRGYVKIHLDSEDFFFSMADKKGYVFEHRLVVAQRLGRCLHPWEPVHHKNGIRDDNRWENLQLTSEGGHKVITILETEIKRLKARVTLLEADNALMEARLLRSNDASFNFGRDIG